MASIRKRGPYQYQVTVRRRGYPDQSQTFVERRDAEAWGLLVESEMTRGIYVSQLVAEQTRLSELIERYIEVVTCNHKGADSEAQRLRMLARTDLV